MKYIKYNSNQNNDSDENIFWVTMSDLLLGLMVVFLTMFIFAITGFTQQKINEKESQYEATEKIAKELQKNNIKAEADKFSGTIKISDLELFELNRWELSEKGKAYMSKFVPVYLDTIMKDEKIRENISQIIIEGHTDSQAFANSKSEEDKYFKNMDLSLKRASSVAQYIVYSNYKGKSSYEKELFRLISVEGKGPSKPVIVNGKEDYAKSRRVELKLTFKDSSILDAIKK